MDNYEHEIECPQNKAIMNYLWYDYFHDSNIHRIEFVHLKRVVSLTLECRAEISDKWKKLKYNTEALDLYLNEHIDEFTYTLTFKGVLYFHEERLIAANDYINGRFIDTAMLRKLKAESRKPLFHFRMQIDDGYIDIIFSDFQIRKKAGRVKYLVNEVFCQIETDSSWKFYNMQPCDDFERYLLMEKLYKAKDKSILNMARENLHLDDDSEDSCMFSAYILGKYGDASDINNLVNLYLNIESYMIAHSFCRCCAVLAKRNILDAIELIQLRNE